MTDLPAVVEIVRAEDLRYRRRSEIDLDTVREQIAADPDFDPDRDQVVAEIGGAAVAAAIVNPRGVNITVHPDHEDAALRRELLDWSQRRQSALGRDTFRLAVPAANPPAVAMARTAGYELERFYALMIRDFAVTGPPEAADVPEGYRMRPIDRHGDVAALHALDDRAFCDRPDYRSETLDEYDKRHISISTFAPEWSRWVESDRGEPAGSLVGFRRHDGVTGYVAVLAVDPAHRRRGIARSLLLAAFAAIHASGLARAELHVASDNPRALELYTGVGMSQGERLDDYVRAAR